MDELQDLLTPALYEQNPFRVLSESVTARTREIERRESIRRQKVKLGLAVDGDSAGLLGPAVLPTEERREAALKRLHAPRDRFLAELFWFWPSADTSDQAFRALEAGDPDAAAGLWEARLAEGVERVAARHNLAVLHHLLGLDDEATLANERKEHASRAKGEARFQRAVGEWQRLLIDPDFLAVVRARAKALNDVRLTDEFVRGVVEALPAGLMRINARLAVAASERSDFPAAQRHMRLLQDAPFNAATRNAATRDALEPLEKRIRQAINAAKYRCADTPHRGDVHVRALHTACVQPFAAIDMLLGKGASGAKAEASPYAALGDGLRDTVAGAMLEGLDTYSRKTNNWLGSVDLVGLAQQVACGEAMRERLQKAIAVFHESAKWGYGWYAPGYWDLPDIVIATLEAARERAHLGDFDGALATLLELDVSSFGRALRWAAANCLSEPAVHLFNTSSGASAKRDALRSGLERLLLANEIDPEHPYAARCLAIFRAEARNLGVSIPDAAALKNRLYPSQRKESKTRVELPAHPADRVCHFCGREPSASNCEVEVPVRRPVTIQRLLGPHTGVELASVRVPRCQSCCEAHRDLPARRTRWAREFAAFLQSLPLRRESMQRETAMTRLGNWASTLGALVCFGVGFGARDNRVGIDLSGFEAVLTAKLHLQEAWINAALSPTAGLLAGLVVTVGLSKGAQAQRRRERVRFEATERRFWEERPEPALPAGINPEQTCRDFPKLTDLRAQGWVF